MKIQKMYHVFYSLYSTVIQDRDSGNCVLIPYDTDIDCVLTQAVQYFRKKGISVNSHSYDRINKNYVLFTDI